MNVVFPTLFSVEAVLSRKMFHISVLREHSFVMEYWIALRTEGMNGRLCKI